MVDWRAFSQGDRQVDLAFRQGRLEGRLARMQAGYRLEVDWRACRQGRLEGRLARMLVG